MKNRIKLIGFLAVAALLAFTMATCGSTGGGKGGSVYDFPSNVTPTPDNPKPFNDISAVEFVSGMRVGWNLGNTLDANGGGSSVIQMETAWLPKKVPTSIENITTLKNAGFNVIRIPVSWTKAANADYKIRDDWMARVAEIVDYAVQNDMYIILNTHHDEGVFKFTDAELNKSMAVFRNIWEQIAAHFKDYDEKLIFESLNEPRTKGSPGEWSGGTTLERVNVNIHHQIFVDTVRKTGSNNTKRFLLINPYAASAETQAMDGLSLPIDTAADKLIVSYHAYAPYDFALNTNKTFNKWDKNKSSDTSPISGPIDRYYNKFVANGIPVIIGEFGAMNKDNVADRAQWALYYVGYARSKGMPCVWWDNGATSGNGELFGLLDRSKNEFIYPEIVNALMKGSE